MWQAETDGSDHRFFMDMDELSNAIYIDYGFMNGYFFYLVETPHLADEASNTTEYQTQSSLYFCDLRTPSKPSVLIDQWVEDEICMRQVDGDHLYYIQVTMDEGMAYYQYDLITHEKHKLFNYTGVCDYFISGDTLYRTSAQDGIEIMNAKTGERKCIFAFENEGDRGVPCTDGQYFYVFQKTSEGEQTSKEALIIDFEGNLVNRVQFPESVLLVFASANHLFLRSASAYDYPVYALLRSELASPDLTIISLTHP